MEIFMWTWKMCIVPGNEIHKLIVVLVLKERFGMDPDDLLAQGIVSFLVKIMFFLFSYIWSSSCVMFVLLQNCQFIMLWFIETCLQNLLLTTFCSDVFSINTAINYYFHI